VYVDAAMLRVLFLRFCFAIARGEPLRALGLAAADAATSRRSGASFFPELVGRRG
jgi:hypothetical protein